MSELNWKVGDWAVFERDIVQIKAIREGGGCSVSDGTGEITGDLLERLRPLTLSNKRIIEYFAYYYSDLSKIVGERGFNYPDISRYFNNLVLAAIDGADDNKVPFESAQDFVRKARDHVPVIHGVALFRAGS